MNLFRKELIAVALALAAVAFTVGFMVGRAGNAPEAQVIATVSASPSPTVSAGVSQAVSALPKASAPAASGVSDTGVVNINTAALEELMTLEGIGETLAGRIIAYRTENGAFRSIDGIMDVSGIGEGKFEKIKSRITVG